MEPYDDDDMYVLPIENYSKINVHQYAELMLTRGDLSNLEVDTYQRIAQLDCQVFFVDECTSVLYYEVTNDEIQWDSTDQESTVVLVLFDFYDSFLDKIDYYRSLIKHNQGQKLSFILINLPG